MAYPLTLEQIQFLAETVGPHFGPVIDSSELPLTDEVLMFAVSQAVATYAPLQAAIANEVFPHTDADTDQIIVGAQAAMIIAATISAHDRGDLILTVARALEKYSVRLQHEFQP